MTVGIATLLYSGEYLPGALTLGYRIRELLRDDVSNYELVVLIEPDVLRRLTSETRAVLQSLFDKIVELDHEVQQTKAIYALNSANLRVLNRPELAYTFHKLQLWALKEYERILYLDSDVFPLKPSFINAVWHVGDQAANQIVAAADCGWPDLFNSGVMVLIPDQGVYEQLMTSLQTFVSIDGADQGFLNQFFNEACHQGMLPTQWLRLPFTYNVPATHVNYQYVPALNFFRNKLSIVHFIGKIKPWFTRSVGEEYSSQWWDSYNRLLERFFRSSPTQEHEHGVQSALLSSREHTLVPSSEGYNRNYHEIQHWDSRQPREQTKSIDSYHEVLQEVPLQVQNQQSVFCNRPPGKAVPIVDPISALSNAASFPRHSLATVCCSYDDNVWDATKGPPSKTAKPEGHKLVLNDDYSWDQVNESATLPDNEVESTKKADEKVNPARSDNDNLPLPGFKDTPNLQAQPPSNKQPDVGIPNTKKPGTSFAVGGTATPGSGVVTSTSNSSIALLVSESIFDSFAPSVAAKAEPAPEPEVVQTTVEKKKSVFRFPWERYKRSPTRVFPK